MSTRVTVETVLEDVSYANTPGTEYEVARGHLVTLCDPTVELSDRFFAILRDEVDEATGKEIDRNALLRGMLSALGEHDVELAKMVTEGGWPSEGLLAPVVGRIVQDFTMAARGISRRRNGSLAASTDTSSTVKR